MFISNDDIRKTMEYLADERNFNKKNDLQELLQKREIGQKIIIKTIDGKEHTGIIEWEPLKSVKRKWIRDLNMLRFEKIESETWQGGKLIKVELK